MEKKLFVLLLSLTMVATMMPLSVFADTNADTEQYVDGDDLKAGDTVKLPIDNSDQFIDEQYINEDGTIDFTVLDNQANTGQTGAFAIARQMLAKGTFSDGPVDYNSSNARVWCQNLFAHMNEHLQNCLLETTKTEEAITITDFMERQIPYRATAINGDQIFLPSVKEAFVDSYFESPDARKTDGAAAWYWLRGSQDDPANNYEGIVMGTGLSNSMFTTSVYGGMRPALNLTENSHFKLVSSNEEGNVYEWADVYKVEIRSSLGMPFEIQYVKPGDKAVEPDVPEGYQIDSWYTYDGKEKVPFSFNTPITSDLTVFGETSILYTVTFMDGDEVYQTQQVVGGYCAKEPIDPEKEGYTFNGWFLTPAAAGSAFDFENTPIKKNTTLYADWIPNDTPTPVPPVNPTNGSGTTNGINTGDNGIAILFAGLGFAAVGTTLVLRKRAKNK